MNLFRKTSTNLGRRSCRRAEARLPMVMEDIREKGRFCQIKKYQRQGLKAKFLT